MDNVQDRKSIFHLSQRRTPSGFIVALAGEFVLGNLTDFSAEIKNLLTMATDADKVELDFSGVSRIDSAAALALFTLREECAAKNIDCRLVNFPENIAKIFDIIDTNALNRPPLKAKEQREGIIVTIGDHFLRFLDDLQTSITFFGGLLVALGYAVFHPRSLRAGAVLFYMRQAGVNGLGIVGLIGMLIGLILAFMSFMQLRMFGANFYVPALVSFAMVKELGPIMTAILVAGRSGSAFAAEIGTMVVNEEVDALTTMGFDPVSFLAVPKIISLIIVAPVLTLYADLFGILGGLTVGVIGLDMSFNTYLTQSLKAISVFDLVASLVKATVFAVVIAGIGCHRGFLTRSGAQDVGRSTTSAVVSAIFMIVVVDSFFAIVLYYLR